MAYTDYTSAYMNQYTPSTGSGYSWAVDPVVNAANQQIASAWKNEDLRRNTEWANQQRMSDPAYWAQAFGFGGGSSTPAYTFQQKDNPYQARLNALLDNPDSISNTGAYKFAFNQGNEAINRNLAAKGLLKSGNRLSELTSFGQGLASQQYGAEMDRLSKLYGIGEQSNIEREKAAALMQIEREKAQNQMKLSMMSNLMGMQKRYMPPGQFNTPAGTVLRWD